MTKLFKHGEEAILEGDEEKAYVYYVRFFNLLTQLKKTPDFNSQKEYLTTIIGGKRGIERTMETLERVSDNLRNRYDKKYEDHKKGAIQSTDLATSHDNQNTKSSSSKEINNQRINCMELHNKLIDRTASMLILDCRPRDDFIQSKIRFNDILNVPEEILVKGANVGLIKRQFDDNEKQLWTTRAFKENIIMLDYNSQDFARDSPIWVLKDILEYWDQDFEDKAPIKILSGGYEMYQMMYPAECLNPLYKPQPAPLDNIDDLSKSFKVHKLK